MKRLVLLELILGSGRQEGDVLSYLIATNLSQPVMAEKIGCVKEFTEAKTHQEIIDVLVEKGYIKIVYAEKWCI